MALRTYTQLQHSSPKLTPSKGLAWEAGHLSTINHVPSLVDKCVQALVIADGSPMRKVDALFPRLPEELAQCLLAALVAHGKVTDDRLSAFLSISRRVIRLGGCGGIRKSVLRQIPFRCPQLTYLDLSNCIQVSNTVVRDILQGCTTLQQLRLDNCRHITDAAFQPDQSLFYPLRACLSLRVLSLAGCSQLTHSLVMYLLKAYRSLEELNFSRCKRITSESMKMLLTSSMHLRLRVLNLSFTDISDDALSTVSLSHLTDIDLGQCKITDAALISLVRHCPRLNVAWCVNLTDAGVADLANSCASLEHVTLTYCTQLTDVSLGCLVQKCPRLQSVHVNGCTGFTPSAVAALPVPVVLPRPTE
ncbi:hypothetical protein B5M09_000524 [Aphanomyces astaci]|uniref:F-box/LRR-repeat protein 15-like leucin rich repeat domain-containing protein n=1 Tax=Aphanomyces astaci TaxID=112090 RepID=A0A425D8S1_APHAT|nr:hypothetical protein B5M09_000524 [Aphanomyces astaci]